MIRTLFLIANLSNFYDANKCKNSLNQRRQTSTKLHTFHGAQSPSTTNAKDTLTQKQFGRYIGHQKMCIYIRGNWKEYSL